MSNDGDLESVTLRVALTEPKAQSGLIDEFGAATKARKRVPWSVLEQIKGNTEVLRRIDEAATLLRLL